MADQGFGKFKSVGDFLDSYRAAEEAEQVDREAGLPFEEQVQQRRALSGRNVVEVKAKLRQRTDDGNVSHLELLITLTALTQGNPAVDDDIRRVLQDGEDVFVAIRVGDPSGITKPIVGLVDGVGLDVKGVWIPEDQAYAHGGKKLPVLHFTHHPLGFLCVDEPAACYS